MYVAYMPSLRKVTYYVKTEFHASKQHLMTVLVMMHETKFYSYIVDLYSRSPSPLLCHLEWDLNIHNKRWIFIDHRNTHICASRCAMTTLAGFNLYRALGTATENTPSNISLVKTQTKTPIDYGCLPLAGLIFSLECDKKLIDFTHSKQNYLLSYDMIFSKN